MQPSIERHVFSVIVNDEPGILARIAGLFSGRGYNIDSLTVARVNSEKILSRITICCSGTPMILEQIQAQLDRLIPTRKVVDLSRSGPILEKEVAFIKVIPHADKRVEMLKSAEALKLTTLEATPELFIFEMTGTTQEIDSFAALAASLGKTEVVRSGVIGISKSAEMI